MSKSIPELHEEFYAAYKNWKEVFMRRGYLSSEAQLGHTEVEVAFDALKEAKRAEACGENVKEEDPVEDPVEEVATEEAADEEEDDETSDGGSEEGSE